MPIGDDLTVVLFGLGLAVTAFITGLSLVERKRKSVIILLFLLTAICLVFSFSWPWLKEEFPKLDGKIADLTANPVSYFVVIMFLAAALLFSNVGNRKTIPQPSILSTTFAPSVSSIILVENIHLAADLTPQTTSPVLLLAEVKAANTRLRVFVEFSYQSRGHFGGPVWVKSRLIQITDLRDVVSGQQIRVPVATCKLDDDEIWWGGKDDAAGNLVQKSHKYRARLKFIGSNNEEQTHRFFLFRTSMTEKPYIVEIFEERDLDMKS